MTGFMPIYEPQEPSSAYLRITGDIHGHVRRYAESVRNCEHSIQIGDLGFGYEGMQTLASKYHKFFGGNHDNYDIYYTCQHSLGDYGRFSLGKLRFYFIRGAYSIDVKGRLKAERNGHPKCFWKEEVMNKSQLQNAVDEYRIHSPQTMLSHTCPTDIAKKIGRPDVLRMFGLNPDTFTEPTQDALQECFNMHKPDVWIFGHFHSDVFLKHKGTLFICLNVWQHLDADKNGNVKHHGKSFKIGQ